jgi:hypothetical protein
MKRLLFILPFILFTSDLLAQGWLTEENNFETNWNTTIQFGSNMLLGELRKDLSQITNDMTNYPGLSANFQISKMVWERIDIGSEIGYSSCSGINEKPSTINYLTLSNKFNNEQVHFLPYPVKYNTYLYNLGLFSKYSFINFRTYPRSYIKINMFIQLGLGLFYMKSLMGYQEKINYQLAGLTDPLFSTKRDLKLSDQFQAYLNSALGFNYQISERFFISVEMSFYLYNTGLLDGVYNISNKLTPDVSNPDLDQYSIPAFDLSGKLLVGFTYFFNLNPHRKTYAKEYPWYFNRYRSYYSKYHSPSSKRKIKERLPFYNNKFDE